jgi:carboxypeptidase C (cathepsin A)
MLPSLLLSALLMQATPPAAETPKPLAEKTADKPSDKEEPPVVTHHEIRVNGKALKYTATAAMMPIRDAKGDVEAHMFFMAYTLDGVSDTGRRPLMFSFNGGPGSASVWLHLARWGHGAW